MPNAISGAAVVHLNETFLLVGGYDGDTQLPLDTIYKYEKADDSWILLETKLPYAAAKPVAMIVDIDIFTPC